MTGHRGMPRAVAREWLTARTAAAAAGHGDEFDRLSGLIKSLQISLLIYDSEEAKDSLLRRIWEAAQQRSALVPAPDSPPVLEPA